MHGLLAIMGSSSSFFIPRGVEIEGQEHKQIMDHNPVVGQSRQVALLALIAIGGIVYFVVAVSLLHFVRLDLPSRLEQLAELEAIFMGATLSERLGAASEVAWRRFVQVRRCGYYVVHTLTTSEFEVCGATQCLKRLVRKTVDR